MIKVLFYIKDPNGGTGRFLENIREGFKYNKNIKIRIVSHIKVKGFYLKTKKVGFPLPKQKRISFRNLFLNIKNLILVKKEIERYSPDIVFSIGLYSNLITALIKIVNKNFYLIHSTHDNIEEHIKRDRENSFFLITKFLIRSLYLLSDLHLVPNKKMKEMLIKKIKIRKNKVISIPNPLNLKKIKNLSKKKIKEKILNKLLRKNITKIFTMTRLVKNKKVEKLLYAFSKLLEEKKESFLFILGDGKLKKNFRKLSDKLSIDKKVIFLGWKKNPYKFLKYADIFILITDREAFPYSLLEAMSLKIPVISSNINFGPKEILDNGKNGILLKTNSIKNITKNLKKMIKNKNLRLEFKKKGYQKIKKYEQEKIVKKYKKLFQYCVKN